MTPQLLGGYVACLEHGYDPMIMERAFASTKSASASYDHRVFRPLIKLACQLMDATDDHSLEANVFRNAFAETEKSASWTPTHTLIATEFAWCLDSSSTKSASFMDSIPVLFAGGGLTAAGLAWLLNRDSTQESATAEQTIAARDLYNQLAERSKRRVSRLMGTEDKHDRTFGAAHSTIEKL